MLTKIALPQSPKAFSHPVFSVISLLPSYKALVIDGTARDVFLGKLRERHVGIPGMRHHTQLMLFP